MSFISVLACAVALWPMVLALEPLAAGFCGSAKEGNLPVES